MNKFGKTPDILSEKSFRHIVESVVGLAGKLGIDTVAEGVETQEQVSCLRALGVDYFQGFYFGKSDKVAMFCREGVSLDIENLL